MSDQTHLIDIEAVVERVAGERFRRWERGVFLAGAVTVFAFIISMASFTAQVAQHSAQAEAKSVATAESLKQRNKLDDIGNRLDDRFQALDEDVNRDLGSWSQRIHDLEAQLRDAEAQIAAVPDVSSASIKQLAEVGQRIRQSQVALAEAIGNQPGFSALVAKEARSVVPSGALIALPAHKECPEDWKDAGITLAPDSVTDLDGISNSLHFCKRLVDEQ